MLPTDSAYERVVHKVWGRELWLTNRAEFCAKVLVVNPGFRSSRHYHMTKAEEFIVLDGTVRLDLVDGSREMRPGERQFLPPGTAHRFGSVAGAMLLEISTYHDDADVVRLEPSGPLP